MLGALRHVSVLATVVIVGTALGWSLFNRLEAPRRMTPQLRAALATHAAPQDIVVDVNFSIEAFHITYLQREGHIVRVERRRVYLDEVSPANIWAVARNYWVARVALQTHPQ